MQNRLILISTHYNNKLLTKFSQRQKFCVVISLDDPKSGPGDCRIRRKEVLDWIFEKIRLVKTRSLDTYIDTISEVIICIDFNIGHSSMDICPLADMVKQINDYEKVPMHFVRDKTTLEEVLSSGITPVKLFLTGDGGTIINDCQNNECVRMTSDEAVSAFSYEGRKAIPNLNALNASHVDENASRSASNLVSQSFLRQQQDSREIDPLIEQKNTDNDKGKCNCNSSCNCCSCSRCVIL